MKTFTASSKTLLSNAALGVVGVALVSTMVVRASSATFTATTDNAGNNWDAGTVVLGDDLTTAMFTPTNLRPGDSETKCINVTYTGSLTPGAPIKIYGVVDGGNALAADATLSDNLDIVLNIFAAGQTCNSATKTRTLIPTTTLKALPADYATGLNTDWTPTGGTTGGETRAFELKYTLNADTGNDAQDDTATAQFVWEANS